MAEIINLRLARKARARAEASRAATVNRAKSGLTKAERIRQQQAARKAERVLDGARREADPDE